METEVILFDFCFDFRAEIVHESSEWICWPTWEAFVERADDELDLVMILSDCLGDGFTFDCSHLMDLTESLVGVVEEVGADLT
jgi:hypothetical protein